MHIAEIQLFTVIELMLQVIVPQKLFIMKSRNSFFPANTVCLTDAVSDYDDVQNTVHLQVGWQLSGFMHVHCHLYLHTVCSDGTSGFKASSAYSNEHAVSMYAASDSDMSRCFQRKLVRDTDRGSSASLCKSQLRVMLTIKPPHHVMPV